MSHYYSSMFNGIPTETISIISSYLNLPSRINLASTSRNVHDAVANTTLYRNLSISASRRQDLRDMIHDRRLNPEQVRVLHINATFVTEPQELDFVSEFTRVQEVHVDHFYVDTDEADAPLKRFGYLAGTITAYDHSRGFEPIFHLLASGNIPFINLTTLSIEELEPERLRNCITNVPNVTSLKLDNCSMSLDLIEHIHRICAYLINLELTNSDLDMADVHHLQEVVAAEGLISFTFSCCLINDTNCTFLDYIIRKYTNLHTFHMYKWLDNPVLQQQPGRYQAPVFTSSNIRIAYNVQLKDLLDQIAPRIQVFGFETYRLRGFLKRMKNQLQHLVELTFYHNGISTDTLSYKGIHPFLRDLPALRTLTVYFKKATYLYEEPEEQQPEKQQPIIYRHIETLNLIRESRDRRDPVILLDQLLLRFTNLRQLGIDAVNRNISISGENILQNNAYPTLEKLDLHGILDNTVIGYIERSLPNVVELSWRNNNSPVRINNFVLPNHTFTMLDINLPPQIQFVDAEDNPEVLYNIHWRDAGDTGMRMTRINNGHRVTRREADCEGMEDDGGEANPMVININCINIHQLQCGTINIF